MPPATSLPSPVTLFVVSNGTNVALDYMEGLIGLAVGIPARDIKAVVWTSWVEDSTTLRVTFPTQGLAAKGVTDMKGLLARLQNNANLISAFFIISISPVAPTNRPWTPSPPTSVPPVTPSPPEKESDIPSPPATRPAAPLRPVGYGSTRPPRRDSPTESSRQADIRISGGSFAEYTAKQHASLFPVAPPSVGGTFNGEIIQQNYVYPQPRQLTLSEVTLLEAASEKRRKIASEIINRAKDSASRAKALNVGHEDRFPRSPPILKFHYEELWQEDPESLRIRLRKSGVGCSSHQSSDDFISLQHDKVLSGLSGRHVLMIGDSMMRYQYLNLAYYLSSGKWRSPSPPNEEEAQHGSWAAFYATTNARLKTEVCDCYRPTVLDYTKYLENRYFIDLSHNFRISYVQQLGSNLFSPHTLGYMNAYCTKEKGCVQKGCTAGQCVPSTHPIDHVGNGSPISGPAAWVTMACSLRPDTVVVNMGLWYILNDPTGYAQVVDASKQILACPGMQSTKFVWKTTTPRSVEIGNQNNANVGDPVLVALLKDHKEWSVFDANGIVQQLKGYAAAQSHNMFWDPVHFRTPVYAGLNQVFLTQLLGNSVVDGGC